jgi:hypothetical protein
MSYIWLIRFRQIAYEIFFRFIFRRSVGDFYFAHDLNATRVRPFGNTPPLPYASSNAKWQLFLFPSQKIFSNKYSLGEMQE